MLNAKDLELYLEDYLQNLCEDSEGCREVDKELNTYITQNTNKEVSWEIDWMVSMATYQHERQGFLAGMAYAAKIFGGKAGAAV